jgi:outer membrane receptor protein involved in Fe transport
MKRLAVGSQLFAQSGIYLRGDEANLLPRVEGFARLDLHARYAFDRRLSLVAQMRNALNTTFSTFGGLGEASLIDDDAEPRFLSPGEPRGVWAGVEVGF